MVFATEDIALANMFAVLVVTIHSSGRQAYRRPTCDEQPTSARTTVL